MVSRDVMGMICDEVFKTSNPVGQPLLEPRSGRSNVGNPDLQYPRYRPEEPEILKFVMFMFISCLHLEKGGL